MISLILAAALSTANPTPAENEAAWVNVCHKLGVLAESTASVRKMGASLETVSVVANRKITSEQARTTILATIEAVYAMPEEMPPAEVGTEIERVCRRTK